MASDVVVAGGGPTGMMLACELQLAGVQPVVLERLTEPSPLTKSNGLVGQVIQMLDYRGLLERFTAEALIANMPPVFDFAGIMLDLRRLDSVPLRRLSIPQPRIERLLNERAHELSIVVRRGHELTALAQDPDGVTLDVSGPDGPYQLRTRYLVGCDGAHSIVRKQAGIGFSGTTNPELISRLGDVDIAESTFAPGSNDLDVPGAGRIRPGLTRTANGVFAYVTRGGVHRVATLEWGKEAAAHVDGPATVEEMRDAIARVLGADLPISHPRWLSRVVDNTRQADCYRAGRVFVVGDAAHVHSSIGGPGLNLGLQDSINLGWKLAAEARGWAPPGLLDSYQSERHPVGERVLMHSQAQTALLAPGANMTKLRDLVTELLEAPQALLKLVEMIAGTDVRYDMRSADVTPHPLVGGWAPDLSLVAGKSRVAPVVSKTRVAQLMTSGRPLLLDLKGDVALTKVAHGWSDRVDTFTARLDSPPAVAGALLVRPDGYVAWATGPEQSPGEARDGLRHALTTWFGAPS